MKKFQLKFLLFKNVQVFIYPCSFQYYYLFLWGGAGVLSVKSKWPTNFSLDLNFTLEHLQILLIFLSTFFSCIIYSDRFDCQIIITPLLFFLLYKKYLTRSSSSFMNILFLPRCCFAVSELNKAFFCTTTITQNHAF